MAINCFRDSFPQAGATLCAGDLHSCEVGCENVPPHCLTLLHLGRVPRFPRCALNFARARSSPGAVPSKLFKVTSREELPTRGSSSAPPIDPLFYSWSRFLFASTRHFFRLMYAPQFQIRVFEGWTSASQFLGRRYAGRVPPKS
jgi:hypothetical protein